MAQVGLIPVLIAAGAAVMGSIIGLATGILSFPQKKHARSTALGQRRISPVTSLGQAPTSPGAVGFILLIAFPITVLAANWEITDHSPSVALHAFGAFAIPLLLIPLVWLLRLGSRGKPFGEPTLILTKAPPLLDEPFHLRVELKALKPAGLAACRARIVCMEHQLMHQGRYAHHVVRTQGECLLQMAGETSLEPGKPLIMSKEIMIKSGDFPPTGQIGNSMYPYYHWEIHVEIEGHAHESVHFPLTVRQAAAAVKP